MAALVPLHSWGVIAARNSFSHSRSRQRWKIRLSSRHALWYWQINSLQGPQKRGLVIHVSPSFLLSVNLLTSSDGASDGLWHGIAFACALSAKDRDLHSVQFVGQFQHARRVRFLGREVSGYDWRSSQKAGRNHPQKLGAAKSMIPTRFQ